VRTASRTLLVQTDLSRADELNGQVLSVWNDIIVAKQGRQIATMNRRDLTSLQKLDIPVRGEGTDTWTATPIGNYLTLRMDWDSSTGSLAGQVACIAALSLWNPVAAAMPPYPEIEHTSSGSFHFLVSENGSISTAVDSPLSFFK
jgi:hypothetical protein